MFKIQLRADHLRHLGLHPEQRWSRITGPERPGWWRAEALRHMIGSSKGSHKHRRG